MIEICFCLVLVAGFFLGGGAEKTSEFIRMKSNKKCGCDPRLSIPSLKMLFNRSIRCLAKSSIFASSKTI